MSSQFQAKACFSEKRKKSTLPIFVVSVADFDTWKESAPEEIKSWLSATGFRPRAGACALLPQGESAAGAVVSVSDPESPWEFAGLTKILPAGSYEAEPELTPEVGRALCLGWALSSYRFDRYKSKKKTSKRSLVWPEGVNRQEVLALAEGISLGRDLVNTPASDMGPEELAEAAIQMGKQHGAKVRTIVGEDLLKQGYPMVHAVGRASSRAPRLIDLSWGKAKHPKLTLVGKGVCFDTGGLDIKPGAYMKLMKKDMGGAALVLGLAHVIMSQGLPVRLRLLIPAVENSVSGNAMRPLDVLDSRKGITVEVGDTDAEGRLVLADALWEADSEDPDLIIDAATLTGAARVALGTEMPAAFASKDASWHLLNYASERSHDPLWRMPLHTAYRRKLESKVADISNIGSDGYGGAITAALFLKEFVNPDRDWLHIDTMGYNLDSRPGRPAGGEALGLLALNAMLHERYAPLDDTLPKTTLDSESAPTADSEKHLPSEELEGKASAKKSSSRARPAAKKATTGKGSAKKRSSTKKSPRKKPSRSKR